MFRWSSISNDELSVTFNQDELVLNERASRFFWDYKWAIIIINIDKQKLAIRPISKNQRDMNLFADKQLYKLHLSHNKIKLRDPKLLERLIDNLNLDLSLNYRSSFSELDNVLIIDLQRKED
ncbi:MAG: hypothetical protein ACI4WG_01880 [Erysipelotrichaceae bacterium]